MTNTTNLPSVISENVFTYAAFELGIEDLYRLLKGNKSNKPQATKYWGHREHMIDSIIGCIASGNYTVRGIRTFRMLEQLVERNGYDVNGHYSADSRAAMNNLYQEQVANGIKARKIELQDIPMTSPLEDLSKKVGGFFKSAVQHSKKWVKRGVVMAGIAVASVFGYNFVKNSMQADSTPLPVKNKTEQKVANKSTAKAVNTAQFNQTARQKIEANKAAYRQQTVTSAEQERQNKIAALKKESYSIRLNILLGAKTQGYVDKVQKKMDAGLFNADGMSAEQLVYAAYQSKVYDGNTIVHKVLSSDKKVSAADNAAFLGYISEMGEYAGKLRNKARTQAQKNGKSLSGYSAFDNASQDVRQAYVKNLQQLRKLRNR